MRAIGYVKLGSSTTTSLKDWDTTFSRYCFNNMHQPLRSYIDGEGSEGEPDAQYKKLLEFLKTSQSEFLIVVPHANHLGDDMETVVRRLVEIDELGSRVMCADIESPDPLQSALHNLGVKGVSRSRSLRIKQSMQTRALQGRVLGKPVFGYRIAKNGKLEVVEQEKSIVELIYRLYTKEKLGLRLIVQQLNERGITTRRGGKWNMASVRDILRNPAYVGTYTIFGIRRPKAHPAIVPPEVYREAQELTKSRRPFGRVAHAEPFVLSGLAYCAYCGNKMTGVTRRQTWKNKDGRRAKGVYRYYQCQSRNSQSTCKYHTWRASVLENLVLSQLKYALAARASSMHGDASQSSGIRQAAVTNAHRRFLKAVRSAAIGATSIKTVGGYLKDLDAARANEAGKFEPSEMTATLEKWDSMDISQQQLFLAEHVIKITVKDDAVDVVV